MFEFVEESDDVELSATSEKVGKSMNGAKQARVIKQDDVQVSSKNGRNAAITKIEEPSNSATRSNEYTR